MSNTAKTYDFGIKTPCTKEELKETTKDLFAVCSLAGVGNFYLTYGGPQEDQEDRLRFYLHFYDLRNLTLHTSHVSVFNYVRVPHTDTKVVAIDPCTFMFYTNNKWNLLCLNDKWTGSKLTKLDGGRETLYRGLSQEFPKKESRLSKIRTGTPGDFRLKSSDGDLIDVHASVLIPHWEFFAAAVKSDMKESTEKVVEIQAPSSTVEVMVRHFYEQDLEMSFQDAANLIVIAKMYDLPELVTLATEKIKSCEKGVDENLTAWQKSLEAENEGLRSYSASKLQEQMPDIVKSKERIDEMSKEDLATLLMDMSLAAKEGNVAPESGQ